MNSQESSQLSQLFSHLLGPLLHGLDPFRLAKRSDQLIYLCIYEFQHSRNLSWVSVLNLRTTRSELDVQNVLACFCNSEAEQVDAQLLVGEVRLDLNALRLSTCVTLVESFGNNQFKFLIQSHKTGLEHGALSHHTFSFFTDHLLNIANINAL